MQILFPFYFGVWLPQKPTEVRRVNSNGPSQAWPVSADHQKDLRAVVNFFANKGAVAHVSLSALRSNHQTFSFACWSSSYTHDTVV